MKNIIFKELKELIRDGRFKISMIITFVLLIIAGVTGFDQYKTTNEQYKTSVQKERGIWDSQEAKNPHSAAHYGTYAFKPKFALSLFDPGITTYTGNSIFLEAHKRNEAAYSEATDQTSLTRFGTLSINFVLLYLFPLVLILIGYNTFSKEKELSTFTLLKSQGVNPIKLAFGKWFSILIPVAIISCIVFLIIGIVLSNLGDFAYFSWSSLLVLFVSYLLYYMIITSVTVLVSMLTKNSGMSLVTCLSLWVLFSFITPKVATNISNKNNPYPTKQQFQADIIEDKKKGLDGHNPWNEEAKKLEAETLKKYGVDSLSQLPFNYDGLRMQKGEEHQAKVYAKHYDELKDIFKKQHNTYQTLAFISPFIPARFLSMNISNTSYLTHWNFSDAAEKYRIATQKFLNDNFKDNSKTGDWGYKASTDELKKLPKFEYRPPTLSKILDQNTGNFILLFVWFLIPTLVIIILSKKI